MEALEVSRKITRLSNDSDNGWAHAVSRRMAGTAYYLLGQLDEARDALQLVLRSRDVLEQGPGGFGHDPYLTAGPMLGLVEWTLGFPQAAIERIEQAVAMVNRIAVDPNTVSYALMWQVQVGIWCRREDLVSSAVHALDEHFRGKGNFGISVCLLGEGVCLVRSGQALEGLKLIEKSQQESLATGSWQIAPLGRLVEAEGYIAAGDAQRCQMALTAAEELLAWTSQWVFQSEIHRLRGKALSLEGDLENAQSSYFKALKVARTQHARSYQLRAATDLADLWASQGKRDEAIDLLSPIHSWFTEGGHLPDLVDAKRLLKRLERG